MELISIIKPVGKKRLDTADRFDIMNRETLDGQFILSCSVQVFRIDIMACFILKQKCMRYWREILIAIIVLIGLGVAVDTNIDPKLAPSIEIVELNDGVDRVITAYNVGDKAQTDDTPCIGATNIDLCKELEAGRRVCASNAYPLYSSIYIEGYGECEVLDRMNAKYSERVDIAYKLDQKWKAKLWGKRTKKVYLIQ